MGMLIFGSFILMPRLEDRVSPAPPRFISLGLVFFVRTPPHRPLILAFCWSCTLSRAINR